MNKISFFFKSFLPEVKSEWKKVTSPGPREVRTTTAVVIVTSFVFGRIDAATRSMSSCHPSSGSSGTPVASPIADGRVSWL